MGVAFTDTLIELAKPSVRAAMKINPQEFFSGRGLTNEEEVALQSGDTWSIWRHARAVESSDPNEQFNRQVKAADVLLAEIDPVIEVGLHGENITVSAAGQVIVDEHGRHYRVVSSSSRDS
jgi:hypothetical protein